MSRSALPPCYSDFPITNVATVPLRSPFRYPGGKTWLVPYAREWLGAGDRRQEVLVEPFAGGGIIGLTAVAEQLVSRAVLVELDDDVASVWETVLCADVAWLVEQIASLSLTRASVDAVVAEADRSTRHRALATIVQNRVNRGGILAPGAGRVRSGENGKGLGSRWYATTLCTRIMNIHSMRSRLQFIHGDAFEVISGEAASRTDVSLFVDPPYTVAGRRLYRHSDVDHERLFSILATTPADSLTTYDDSPEITRLALGANLQVRWVPMKTTHHTEKLELLVGRDLSWVNRLVAPAT